MYDLTGALLHLASDFGTFECARLRCGFISSSLMRQQLVQFSFHIDKRVRCVQPYPASVAPPD